VSVWDLATVSEVLVIRDAEAGKFSSVAFSPCGGYLAAASQGGFVRLLDGRPYTPALAQERAAVALARFWSSRGLPSDKAVAGAAADPTADDAVRRLATQILTEASEPGDVK